MKSKKVFAIGALALALLLGACSSSSDTASESATTEEAAFPTEDLTLNISWWGEQEAPGAQKWLEESIAL
ncbi:MAG: hypothetical protein RL057_665 [Actinomycetota bacterium]|jgi:ABC-type glycerol-3-phosphate transport system substrate-binding protein